MPRSPFHDRLCLPLYHGNEPYRKEDRLLLGIEKPDLDGRAAWEAGRKHLFYIQDGVTYFNFTALERMNVHLLRQKLLGELAKVSKTNKIIPEASSRIANLLRDYSDAIRDREYMRKWGRSNLEDNPFVISDRDTMEAWLAEDLIEKGMKPNDMVTYSERHNYPILPCGPWDYESATLAQLNRVAMAVLGSIILVGPMIFMVLVPTVWVKLITSTVCTVIFAIASAKFANTRLPLELLSATAAYTAILVVFVGTSS